MASDIKLFKSPLLSKLVPAAFYALLVIFLALYLRGIDWAKLQHLHISWIYILAATATGLCSRYWSVFIWFTLLKNLGATGLGKSLGQLTYVYSKSWLGRYIPGTAPWILGKIYFASKHGIAKQKLAVSSLLEGGLQVMMLIVVSFILLLSDKRSSVIAPGVKLLMAAALVFCVAALTPVIFNRLVKFAYRLLRRKTLADEHLPSGQTIIRGSALYVIGALLNGLSLFFISKAAFPGLPYHDMLFIMGASNFAGALGMLALFVPSGLGVREGVALVLLSAVIPKEISVVIVVFSRLWSVGIDFLFFGLSWCIRKISYQ